METITTAGQLKDKIEELERRQRLVGSHIRGDFQETYENLKPAGLVKNAVHNLTHDPELKKDLLKAALFLAIGFVVKRIILRASRNPWHVLIGNFAEVAIAGYIARNPEKFKLLAQNALRFLVKLRGKPQPKLLLTPVPSSSYSVYISPAIRLCYRLDPSYPVIRYVLFCLRSIHFFSYIFSKKKVIKNRRILKIKQHRKYR